jgi:hypothetical protein
MEKKFLLVGIVARLRARLFIVRFPAEARVLSLLQNVQIGSGVHLASLSMGTGVSFPGDKAAEA